MDANSPSYGVLNFKILNTGRNYGYMGGNTFKIVWAEMIGECRLYSQSVLLGWVVC